MAQMERYCHKELIISMHKSGALKFNCPHLEASEAAGADPGMPAANPQGSGATPTSGA